MGVLHSYSYDMTLAAADYSETLIIHNTPCGVTRIGVLTTAQSARDHPGCRPRSL